MVSDNPEGAENQQERLMQQGWVIGFVDGEGCLSIGFIRQAGGGGRVGYRTGNQTETEAAQNPQRPYAEHPGHWMKRWSHLHGDMQGRRGAQEDTSSAVRRSRR